MSAAPRAIALLYHDVTEPGGFDASGFTGPLADTYKLTIADFVAHLDAVAARRGDAPVLADAALAPRAGRAPWMITFDDGGVTALHPTADLLERRGWRGLYFITTGRTGTPGFLDADQVRELDRRGHLVGVHTVTHPARMADLDDASLDREWRDSRAALEALLGHPVTVGSVPGGLYTDRVARAAERAGLTILFNSEPTQRVRRVGACAVVGRYAFKTTSPAAEAARLAAGDAAARAALWLTWNGKKAVKTLSPAGFRLVRRVLTGLS